MEDKTNALLPVMAATKTLKIESVLMNVPLKAVLSAQALQMKKLENKNVPCASKDSLRMKQESAMFATLLLKALSRREEVN